MSPSWPWPTKQWNPDTPAETLNDVEEALRLFWNDPGIKPMHGVCVIDGEYFEF